MAEPFYCTATELRTYLDVTSGTLSDEAAIVLIEDAEDWVDNLLGGWYPDETTGRKILEADVLAWQWSKLNRATIKAAGALYNTPALFTQSRYRKESGPDFSVEDPQGGGPLAPAVTLLNASGLRRLTGRATAGSRAYGPPWLGFSRNLPDGY